MNKKTISSIAKKRSIYLIDIENLVGASEITEDQVAEVRANLLSVAPAATLDQFYVASSHHNAQAAGFGWPQAQHEFKSGPDGADFMIVKEMIALGNVQRFDHVYVASGDGAMAWYIDHLVSCGVKVTVLAYHRGYSNDLRFTESQTPWLDDEYILAA